MKPLAIAAVFILLSVCGEPPAALASDPVFVITPYLYKGAWVFDDAGRNISKEPFVAGVPEMIDKLVAGIPNAEKGFQLLFSDQPFSGYTHKLVLRRKEAGGGSWYYSEQFGTEGWLCPTLLKYFQDPPQEIYVKAEPH